MNKQESRALDTWCNEIEQGFMQRGGWKACRHILGEIFNQRQEELERLQAIVGALIGAIDEHGGAHWRDPRIYTAYTWGPLREAVAAAEAATEEQH